MHHFVGADSSCISWGHAQYGELGYGPNGQKYVMGHDMIYLFVLRYLFPFLIIGFLFWLLRSSAVPKKVEILDGMHVMRCVFVFVLSCLHS